MSSSIIARIRGKSCGYSHFLGPVLPTIARTLRQPRCHRRSFATRGSIDTNSWLSLAQKGGVASMIGEFRSIDRFDDCLNGMVIEEARETNGYIRARYDLSKTGGKLGNSYSTLHGGVTATIVDVVGSMSIFAANKRHTGVSVDINVSYLRPAKLSDTIVIEAKTLKSGKSLAFSSVDIRRASDGELIATGRHTKALPAM